MFAGVAVGSAWNSNAATAAAWGAAADVPKKFGNPSPSVSVPKNVVSTPSGAMISGLSERASGVASRLPDKSNRIGVVPDEEKDSKTGGETPKAGVLEYRTAPTASAAAALAWPNIVPLWVSYSFTLAEPMRMYLINPGFAPENLTIIMFTVTGVIALFVNEKISTASPPILLNAVPARICVAEELRMYISTSFCVPGAPLTE